jgi:CBS-domain-containing membrane protein
MQVTRTLHPPAGATALIAVLGPEKIHELSYRYPIVPVLAGAALMVLVALACNNLSASDERRYPVTWR